MMDLFKSNTRDVLLIFAMVWLATISLFVTAIFAWKGRTAEAALIMGLALNIGGALAAAYKGNPTNQAPNPPQNPRVIQE